MPPAIAPIFAAALASSFAKIVISIAISLALNFVMSLLADDPPEFTPPVGEDPDRTQTIRSPAEAWYTVYGEARLGGTLTFLTTKDDNQKQEYSLKKLARLPRWSYPILRGMNNIVAVYHARAFHHETIADSVKHPKYH